VSIGDLVSIVEAHHGKQHVGIIIDLYDALAPDGEAQILWDDGNIYWEMLSQLQHRTEVINEGR
tara:strand:+ start:1594 stop:1785 length:192 start_codon:yes stop_codon:yes gene_type:complete